MDAIPEREIRVIQIDDSQFDEKFKQRLAEVSKDLPPVIIDTIKERLLMQKINYEAELAKLNKHHEQVSLNTIEVMKDFYIGIMEYIKDDYQTKTSELIDCHASTFLGDNPDYYKLVDDEEDESYTRSMEATAKQAILALRKKGYKCSSKYISKYEENIENDKRYILIKLDFTE